MIFRVPHFLPAGRELPSPWGVFAIGEAADEDWDDCLGRAVCSVRNGAARLPAELTTAEGLAGWAARYLASGNPGPLGGEISMGRPADDSVWAETWPRWQAMAEAAAEKHADADYRTAFVRAFVGLLAAVPSEPEDDA